MTSCVRSGTRGFSLIELLIAMAIVAILAAVAIPNYRNYVLRSGRVEALGALSALAALQERYRLDHNGYATLDQLNAPNMQLVGTGASAYLVTDENRYTIHLTTITATSFLLEARNYTRQSDDSRCGHFRLSNTGTRSMGQGTLAECWR